MRPAAQALAGPRLSSGRRSSVSPGSSTGQYFSRVQIAEMQRSRLIAGAVEEIDRRGWAHTTVAHIAERARVSRRTFYDLFAGREECLSAVLDEAARLVGEELAQAGLGGLSWRERVRTGLATILSFLDCEPALARVCVVEAGYVDARVLRRRGELLAVLAAAVDEGRLEGSRGAEYSPLTAEGLVGAGLAIVHARILSETGRPLTDLLGELMGLIVLPYLGPAAARREPRRPAPVLSAAAATGPSAQTWNATRDPLEGLRIRLTYRTARVLEAVGQLQGSSPSNRLVADHAGVRDLGQISKLLRRLERLGLLTNSGEGARVKGEPNAWALTDRGERVAQSILCNGGYRSEAA